jgi:hypothetical protein
MSGGYNYYLGLFDSEREAAVMYARAHRKLFGDVASKKALAKGKRKRAAEEVDQGAKTSPATLGLESAPTAISETATATAPSIPAESYHPSILPSQPVPGLGGQVEQYAPPDATDSSVDAQMTIGMVREAHNEDLPSLVSRLKTYGGEDPSKLRDTADMLRRAAAEAELQAATLASKGQANRSNEMDQTQVDEASRQRAQSFADSLLPRVDEREATISTQGEAGIVKIPSTGDADIPPPVQHPLPPVGGLQVPPAPPNSAISAGTGPPRFDDEVSNGVDQESKRSRESEDQGVNCSTQERSFPMPLTPASSAEIDEGGKSVSMLRTRDGHKSLRMSTSFDDEDVAAAALAAASQAD